MMRFENNDNLEKIPHHLNCKLAHNVPAVTDGFLFAIKKLRSSFSQTKKCGGAKHHKGRKPDWCFA